MSREGFARVQPQLSLFPPINQRRICLRALCGPASALLLLWVSRARSNDRTHRV